MSFHCYYEYSFSTAPEEHGLMGPCGQGDDSDNLQCCAIGETCMSNGICAYSYNNQGGSGYYIGGCTDETMTDPRCPKNCTAFGNSDVVYDYNVGAWKCCGSDENGNRNCSVPEGSELQDGAPAPLELQYVATVVATGSSVPLASKIPSLSSSAGSSTTDTGGAATATVTLTTDNSSSKGLSAGASAGIAIAAVLAVVAAVAIGIWIFSRRRRRHLEQPDLPVTTGQPQIAAQEKPAFGPPVLPSTSPQNPRRSQIPELSPVALPHELGAEPVARR